MNMPATSLRTIFLIEDDANDAETIQRALMKSDCTDPVHHFYSGEDAFAALDAAMAHGSGIADLPQLIFLDLNLPGMDGYGILKRLKTSETYRQIPVVILSSSGSLHSVANSYSLGANSYVVKPVSFESLTDKMRAAHHYWFDIAVMPKILL